MKKIILIIYSILCYSEPNAQDIKKYVQDNTIQINSNHPDSLDFADLEPIGDAIADSRIVFLGEQDHGDAPTFLAKTRLIKYLHEQKGFNVIAFESDFFALNFGWDELPKNKKNSDSFLIKNIFPIWTLCDACETLLYDYVPGTFITQSPIQVTGFDNQMALNYSSRFLFQALDSVLKSYALPITRDAGYVDIVPLLNTPRYDPLRTEEMYIKQLSILKVIKEQLAQKIPADHFWMMVVDNMLAENAQYSNQDNSTKSGNIRDRQMALNLLWLSKVKYKDEKIIVWAHNSHIAKFAAHYANRFLDKRIQMGSVVEQLKDTSLKTYTIGFTSYAGTSGRLSRIRDQSIRTVKEPQKNSFENWINDSHHFAFVDFTKFNYANTGDIPMFVMKGHHHDTNQNAAWTKIFDAVFFIREMYPCKFISSYSQKDKNP